MFYGIRLIEFTTTNVMGLYSEYKLMHRMLFLHCSYLFVNCILAVFVTICFKA